MVINGPWWVHDRRPIGEVQIECEHRGEDSRYCVATVNRFEGDVEKIAALISAAPDLLKALEEIMDYAYTGAAVRDVYTSEQPQFVNAELAIKKAKGANQ